MKTILSFNPLNIWRLLALVAVVAVAFLSAASEEQALADSFLLRSNQLMAKLDAKRAEDALDDAAALAIIQSDISPILNFPRLTKRAMGKHWKRADAASQEQIIVAFQGLLENTYAKILSRYSDQQLVLVESKRLPANDISILIEVSDGEKIVEIDYIFSPDGSGENIDEQYLISDIKIEGISLVTNYRRQFSQIIRKAGIDGLIDKLQQLKEKRGQ